MLLVLALQGCGLWHNVRRFSLEAEYAAPLPAGEVAQVAYTTPDGLVEPFAPAPFDHEGTSFGAPLPIERGGIVSVIPDHPVTVRLFVARTGVGESGFVEVHALTGTLDRRIPVGIHPLPVRPFDHELRLAVRDLRNPYNGYRFDNRDLLLLQISDERTTEQYLFQLYDLGVRAQWGGGVLVPVSFPGFADDVRASPSFVGSLTLGYRFARRNTFTRLADLFSVVLSSGIGSTALTQEGPIEDQLTGVFDSGVAGGGVAVFDFVSFQVLVNVSALFRDGPAEATAVPVIGFDAVQFGRFGRRAFARLFGDRDLILPPPRDGTVKTGG